MSLRFCSEGLSPSPFLGLELVFPMSVRVRSVASGAVVSTNKLSGAPAVASPVLCLAPFEKHGSMFSNIESSSGPLVWPKWFANHKPHQHHEHVLCSPIGLGIFLYSCLRLLSTPRQRRTSWVRNGGLKELLCTGCYGSIICPRSSLHHHSNSGKNIRHTRPYKHF